MTIFILGAIETELAPARKVISSLRREDILCEAVGVGLTSAAIETTRLLMSWRNRLPGADGNLPSLAVKETPQIIWIGSVGRSPASRAPIHGMVSATETMLASVDLATAKAHIPADYRQVLTCSQCSEEYTEQIAQACLALGLSCDSEKVGTTLAVTADDNAARQLEDFYGPYYESLELYSIAAAAKSLSAKWTTLSPVTNTIGSHGSAEWKLNHRQAAINVAKLLEHLFSPSL